MSSSMVLYFLLGVLLCGQPAAGRWDARDGAARRALLPRPGLGLGEGSLGTPGDTQGHLRAGIGPSVDLLEEAKASSVPWTPIISGLGSILGDENLIAGDTVRQITDVVDDTVSEIQAVGKGQPRAQRPVAARGQSLKWNESVSDASETTAHVEHVLVSMVREEQSKPNNNPLSGLTNILNKMASAASALKDAAKLLKKFVGPVPTGGHDRDYINKVVITLIVVIAAAIVLGLLVDFYVPMFKLSEGRPKWWLIAMLVTSYAVLIPGLQGVLFSFTLAVELLGLHVTITMDDNKNPAPITDSMLSVIERLFETGAHFGAVLIVLYAIVVPALKLLLLFVGELWRYSEDKRRVYIAHWSIQFVQMISKWACPDMFVQILLLYLFRSLNDRSPLIAAPAHLDVGFTCFSIFCACSTFSTLAIRKPPQPEAVAETAATPPWSMRCCGPRGALWITAALTCAFAVTFTLGMILPSLGLRIAPELLVQPQGPLPQIALPIIKALDLSSQVNADVSMSECMVKLFGWVYLGEANCILAILMLGGFALLLPVLDMLVLVYVAAQIGEKKADSDKAKHCRDAMAVSYSLKHLEMLDVALMGVFVIKFVGGSFKDQGVEFKLMAGLAVMAVAEVLHYITYYTVRNAIEFHVQELSADAD